jgi:transcriptional regulator with XRE-family HTH domain
MTSQNDPVSPFYVDLGEKLRRTRKAHGWSLQRVYEVSEGRFAANLIGGYERGSRRASLETLCELAEFYGVPVSTFLPDSTGADLVPLDAIIGQLEALRGTAA